MHKVLYPRHYDLRINTEMRAVQTSSQQPCLHPRVILQDKDPGEQPFSSRATCRSRVQRGYFDHSTPRDHHHDLQKPDFNPHPDAVGNLAIGNTINSYTMRATFSKFPRAYVTSGRCACAAYTLCNQCLWMIPKGINGA